MHAKKSEITLDCECCIFNGLPEKILGARYHSLAALPETITEELKVTAKSDDGEIMAVKHAKYDVYGLQFHPESILTPDGRVILANFIGEKK